MGAGASANSSAKKLQSKLQEELTKPLDVHDVHTLGEAKEEIARLRKALRDVQGALGGGGGSAESSPRRTSHFHEHLVHEKHAQGQTFDMVYEVGSKVLGEGMTSCVKICTNIKTGHKYALKTLQINRLDPSKMAELRDEITIMKALDHPNIVRLYDVYEERNKMYLVLEYCEGGELFDRLVDKGTYSGNDDSAAFKQLLGALEHLHARGVVHRDLKPENILLQSKDSDVDIKLSDFGVATILQRVKGRRRQVAKTFIGSLLYLAPEIALGAPYTERVDMWSAGIILYCLLAAEPPLNVGTIEEYIQVVGVSGKVADTIGRNSASAAVPGGGGGGGGRGGPGGGSLFGGVGEEDSFDGGGGGGGGRSMSRSQEEIVRSEASWPSFDSEAWADVSPIAKDLVLALLKRDPSQRLTASEALRHPWIAGGASNRSRPLSQSSPRALYTATPRSSPSSCRPAPSRRP